MGSWLMILILGRKIIDKFEVVNEFSLSFSSGPQNETLMHAIARPRGHSQSRMDCVKPIVTP